MMETAHSFRTVARLTLPCAFGMVPLGIAFGVLVVQSGLAWWWAPAFGGLVYAGSLEFLLLAAATAATPVSPAAVAVTTLLVNGRHVFYCLTFPLHRVAGPLARAYGMFALIDEAYALTSVPPGRDLTGPQLMAMQILLQTYWVGGGVLGATVGGAVAAHLPDLSWVLTGLFAVLATEAVRALRSARVPLYALGCAVVAWLVAPGQFLLVAMGLFVAGTVAAAAYGERAVVRDA
ncbi:AzlC family ABC transporter permease [Streptomyces sp. NRRL F-5126]|uniref:AzlC family ABC transporter permease n=1 Tax=Streptomyces sp. NRRL F-5126 TaxID=1463857 RepID=UPI00068E82AC|nr:AzlC family ABC transporter permease [Streptomyces sp. NRRL F-5126]